MRFESGSGMLKPNELIAERVGACVRLYGFR